LIPNKLHLLSNSFKEH